MFKFVLLVLLGLGLTACTGDNLAKDNPLVGKFSVIKKEPPACGHAKGGKTATLYNTDKSSSHTITVETQKIKKGYKGYPKTGQSVHRVPAGGSKVLGCTHGKFSPWPTIKYTILGEAE